MGVTGAVNVPPALLRGRLRTIDVEDRVVASAAAAVPVDAQCGSTAADLVRVAGTRLDALAEDVGVGLAVVVIALVELVVTCLSSVVKGIGCREWLTVTLATTKPSEQESAKKVQDVSGSDRQLTYAYSNPAKL